MKLKMLLIAMLAGLMFLWIPASASAFDFFPSTVCQDREGIEANASESGPCKQAASQGTNNPVVHIIQLTSSGFALFGGMLAILMIIAGGFQYITSGGSSESTANAKKKIVNSVVGIIFIALAWTIIRLITDKIIS